jgi:hypothetical protein
MKLVIIESPYASKNWFIRWRNVRYARRAMADSLRQNEAPFLSHLLYTQVLNDNNKEERKQGIEAGLSWGKKAEKTVMYIDYGYSAGMTWGMQRAVDEEREIEVRSIGKNPFWLRRIG